MIDADRLAKLRATARGASAPTAVRPPSGLRRVDVDVRADIASGVEPFAKIMTAVNALASDEALVLRVPFEPIPLYGVLGKRGFSHWTEAHSANGWTIWFFRGERVAEVETADSFAGGRRASGGVGKVEAGASSAGDRRASGGVGAMSGPPRLLDVRGLEPPAPLVLVLERLDTLGPADELVVVHDRRPMFLYPQLEDRGFTHRTDEPEPGVVHITIRRAKPAS